MSTSKFGPKQVADDSTVEQCPGISHSWAAKFKGEPHPAKNRYEGCWRCGADLGCERCSGLRKELVCMNGSGKRGGKFFGHGGYGPVWATRDAFIEHGLFAGQKLEDYPEGWHALYRATQGIITPTVNLSGLIAGIGK